MFLINDWACSILLPLCITNIIILYKKTINFSKAKLLTINKINQHQKNISRNTDKTQF